MKKRLRIPQHGVGILWHPSPLRVELCSDAALLYPLLQSLQYLYDLHICASAGVWILLSLLTYVNWTHEGKEYGSNMGLPSFKINERTRTFCEKGTWMTSWSSTPESACFSVSSRSFQGFMIARASSGTLKLSPCTLHVLNIYIKLRKSWLQEQE